MVRKLVVHFVHAPPSCRSTPPSFAPPLDPDACFYAGRPRAAVGPFAAVASTGCAVRASSPNGGAPGNSPGTLRWPLVCSVRRRVTGPSSGGRWESMAERWLVGGLHAAPVHGFLSHSPPLMVIPSFCTSLGYPLSAARTACMALYTAPVASLVRA